MVLKDAATVILLRPGTKGPECFLLRRHGKSAFMGGAYVFPGGKLDDADGAEAMRAHLPDGAVDRAAARIKATPGLSLPAERAVGFWVAAIRETFEEAGVLLARTRDGAPLGFENEDADRFENHRRALNDGRRTFLEILAEEQLVLDFDGLVYWSHWITPSVERRRYDTRFFVARMPNRQTATFDQVETTDQAWMTPAEALLAHDRQDIFLPPPTQRNLQELEPHDEWSSVAEQMKGTDVPAILPKLGVEGEKLSLLLPWDPAFADAEGDHLPGPVAPNPHPHLPTRIVFQPPGR